MINFSGFIQNLPICKNKIFIRRSVPDEISTIEKLAIQEGRLQLNYCEIF